jgi:drug/metabolite transporter (DMT)-like permease
MTASAIADGRDVGLGEEAQARADRITLIAFLLAVGFGGLGTVFVRVTLREIPPMWGGALRFTTAAVILLVIVRWRGIERPRGRALIGAVLFGLLGMGLSTLLIYRSLVSTPAGVAQVMLALVPLETLLFAVAVRLEGFRWEGLFGSAIAIVGVAVVFGDQLGDNVPLVGLLAILGAGLSISSTTVALKWFPANHPLAAASVALPMGAALFWIASFVFDEPHVLPSSPAVWAALTWLTFVGTLGVMLLFLFVIGRMSASKASYQFLLMPLVTVVASAVVNGEQISPAFIVGGAIVLLGVYVGIVRTGRISQVPVPELIE